MKCIIPEISWHNRDPVLSVDIQPRRGHSDDFWRLASSGTDAHVLIWYITIQESGIANLEFAADLTRHQKAVNVVRFSPSGEFLASGDDESVILIWKQKTDQDLPELPTGDEEGNAKEQWISLKVLRGHVEDVYDLCWSPDSTSIFSGSVDNTAIFWDVQKGRNTGILSDHKGFVQGVAWDPQNQYVATMSSDRLCRVYNINTKRAVSRIYKSWLPGVGNAENPEEKVFRLYHDDTLKTFFRRLTFTPDGELLITPSGVIEKEGDLKNINVTYIYSRHLLNRPVVYLPTGDKYTIAVRCCPVLFELRADEPGDHSASPKEDIKNSQESVRGDVKSESAEEKMEVEDFDKPEDEKNAPETPKMKAKIEEEKPWEKHSSLFALPYRVVFAVATQKSVILYDTQQPLPFAKISNIHYTRLTDITWSSDGRILVVSSTDGYCSAITFAEGELGIPYKGNNEAQNSMNSSPVSAKKPAREEKAQSEEQVSGVKQIPSATKGKYEKVLPENSDKKIKNVAKKSETSCEELRVNSSDSKGISNNKSEVVSEGKPVMESTVNSANSMDTHESMNNSSPTKKTPEKNKSESPMQVNGNKTPAQEQRKTPRRVQLITLSSPKSKKRLM
ncbi:chromatin assembly factor 1 subunit B [Ischnura elegans]|uniref:chromatin assembly factor 1 subunit B n=1 Tax=Ischnura elegans TaxID=197161 RepID=UPI001ED8BD4B|nr:chromatin assembly factor 1 subunit B [Ischnura elegans]